MSVSTPLGRCGGSLAIITIVLMTLTVPAVAGSINLIVRGLARQIAEDSARLATSSASGRYDVAAEARRFKLQLPKVLSNKILYDVQMDDRSNSVTFRYWMVPSARAAAVLPSDALLASDIEAIKCDWLGTDNLFDTIRDRGFGIEIDYGILGQDDLAVARTSFADCNDSRVGR